ncbi:MAG: FkbM family methyltransferase [Bacteroidota bacterium]
MTFKSSIQSLIKKTTGYTLTKDVKQEQKLPFGVSQFYDIKKNFNGIELNTFFDVGANVGRAAKTMRRLFPNAEIHSIEPFKTTFNTLKENTQNLNINYHNIALGSTNETAEVKISVSNINSDTNSILAKNSKLSDDEFKIETIEIKKLDDFCKNENIQKIDYLKIDTEGFDLDVIKGAANYLKNNLISFVEAEVGMNPTNKFHSSFEEVKKYLENNNYYLFGLYEQVNEWETETPILRRCNALFVSYELAKKYARKS